MRVKFLAQEHKQCPRPGLEPGPLDPWTSALTMRPPRLPPTCDGLASRPGGVEILLAASCYGNRDKLRPDETAGSIRLHSSCWPRLTFSKLKITNILLISSGWRLEKSKLPWEQIFFTAIGMFPVELLAYQVSIPLFI